jgi:hypothetical protein
MASPDISRASSPKVTSPKALPKPTSPKATVASEEIDFTLISWLTNIHSVLHSPLKILSVIGLLVLGSFVEIAPRKSIEFLDNTVGRSLFFILPFLISILIDWPTGLLAATVSLIIFARLQKQDASEGFSDVTEGSGNSSTQLISSPHRWFIERMLGESPIAISSDRVTTSTSMNNGIRSSSSSMDTNVTPAGSFSSSSSHK